MVEMFKLQKNPQDAQSIWKNGMASLEAGDLLLVRFSGKVYLVNVDGVDNGKGKVTISSPGGNSLTVDGGDLMWIRLAGKNGGEKDVWYSDNPNGTPRYGPLYFRYENGEYFVRYPKKDTTVPDIKLSEIAWMRVNQGEGHENENGYKIEKLPKVGSFNW